MKYLFRKKQRKIFIFKKFEIKQVFLKTICIRNIQIINLNPNLSMHFFSFYSKFPINSFLSRQFNCSLYDGTTRSVLGFFSLSRGYFKHVVTKGLLPFIKKSSW